MSAQPAIPPSAWEQGRQPSSGPRWKRRLVIGIAIVGIIAIAVVAAARSSLGRGIGAAIAVSGRSIEVQRAFYSESTNRPPLFEVWLKPATAAEEATPLGCTIVAPELGRAGLAGTAWVIYDAAGATLVDSGAPCT